MSPDMPLEEKAETSTVVDEQTPSLLTTRQRMAVYAVEQGRNVLITGPAGTGKSFVIKSICDHLDESGRVYRLLAPTGVAAVNIGGQTIHRFVGIDPSIKTLRDYKVRRARFSKVLWHLIEVLIIDECSMLHPSTFELLEAICRFHKKGTKPFGGIQIVLAGDFYQLAPIKEPECTSTADYIFETGLWMKLDAQVVVLNEIQRQKDEAFKRALNDLRVGRFTPRVKRMIDVCTANEPVEGKHYVKIFALNMDKDRYNSSQLAKLKGQPRNFMARDMGDERYLKDCRAPKLLTLKVGCPVMLLRNLPEDNLCNGSVGVVTRLDGDMPMVKFDSGPEIPIERQSWKITEKVSATYDKVIASRTQFPLAIAYAIVAHKSQSLTIDYLEVDCRGVFTTGQLYVMLSRASSKEGLIVRNFDKRLIMVDDKIAAFYGGAKCETGVGNAPEHNI